MKNLTTIYLKDFLKLTSLSGGIFLLYNYFWPTQTYFFNIIVVIILVGLIYLLIINRNSTVPKIKLAKYFISLAFLPTITTYFVLLYSPSDIAIAITPMILVLGYTYATSFALKKIFPRFEKKIWLKASIISNVLSILWFIFLAFISNNIVDIVDIIIIIGTIGFIMGTIITLILLRGFSKIAKNNEMTLISYKTNVTILVCGLLMINPTYGLFFWQPVVSALLVWSLSERKEAGK